MKKRLIELDALRGIAALSVVIYHYTTRYNSLYGHDSFLDNNYFHYCSQGVQLFFMISGFVIFLTLNHIKKPMDFVISRFSRLYPPILDSNCFHIYNRIFIWITRETGFILDSIEKYNYVS